MDKITDLAKAIRASSEDKNKTSPYDTIAKVVRVEGNTAYVHIPGGVEQTPALMAISAKTGDEVRVRVGGGKAYVTGNATAPPTDDSYARKAEAQAIRATQAADAATEQAGIARRSADSAVRDATTAKESANTAVADAATARESAESAQASADSAQESAESALNSATDAATYAEQALGEATQATEYANEAKESAIDALTAATEAQESASDANTAAQNAIKSADTALKNLGIVEDVVSVVEWISTHGYYAPCTESEVFDNKVYYTVVATAVSNPDGNPSSNGYYELVDDQYLITEDDTVVSGKTYYTLQATQVSEPTGDPSANSYYQLVLKEAVAQYVNTHLALTDDGLWVTNDNESEYRMLISANSIQIRNKQNDAVATYGDAITLGVGNTVTTIDNEKMDCDKIVFTELYPKGTGLVLIARSNGHFSIKPVE